MSFNPAFCSEVMREEKTLLGLSGFSTFDSTEQNSLLTRVAAGRWIFRTSLYTASRMRSDEKSSALNWGITESFLTKYRLSSPNDSFSVVYSTEAVLREAIAAKNEQTKYSADKNLLIVSEP